VFPFGMNFDFIEGLKGYLGVVVICAKEGDSSESFHGVTYNLFLMVADFV